MANYTTVEGNLVEPRFIMCQNSDIDSAYVHMDELSNSLRTIENEHSEIHKGQSFACHYSQTVSDTGDKSIIAFKTGNAIRFAHLTFAASSSAPAVASILEAPTIADDQGDSLTVFNRKRTGGNASEVIDTSQNPDVVNQAMFFTEITMGQVTGGTILDTTPLIAGQGPFAIGGAARGQQEWILAKDTLHAFVVESLDAADNIHRLNVDWYENASR